MRSRALFAICLLGALNFGSAREAIASESVWSGIVIANNVARPDPISTDLRSLEETLKELFGYNQFKVIGQTNKTLKTGEEDWLASSKYFSLRIDSKASANATYLLNLQLFQEQKLLLETEARLSKSSPLVIKGPQIGDGQLLLVLVVQ